MCRRHSLHLGVLNYYDCEYLTAVQIIIDATWEEAFKKYNVKSATDFWSFGREKEWKAVTRLITRRIKPLFLNGNCKVQLAMRRGSGFCNYEPIRVR